MMEHSSGPSLSILVQRHRFAWEVFLAWKLRSSERLALAVVIRPFSLLVQLGSVLDLIFSCWSRKVGLVNILW